MIDRKETLMSALPFHAPLRFMLMSGLQRRVWIASLVLSLLTASLPGCSRAYQAITVCPSGCMFTAIQEGIAHAAAGDVVMIGAGVYQENIVLAAGVSLQGAGPGVTIIDGGQRNSVVRGLSAVIGPDVALTEMTLRNGRAVNGGGLLAQGASPTLRNLVIENCQAIAIGGGVAVINSGGPTLQGVTLANNRAAKKAASEGALRHLSVVRYDAFGDVGGHLSWSVALLDDAGDGVVLTSIHGRSEARTYAKTITGWSSDAPLSPEEEEAVTHARG